MATATQVQVNHPTLKIMHGTSTDTAALKEAPQASVVNMDEAMHLADLCRPALNTLAADLPFLDHSKAYTANEIIALPLDKYRLPDALFELPRRKSSRHQLAVAVASLLHPCEEGSLTAVIRYEQDRVRLRGWGVLQRKYDLLSATKRNGHTIPGWDNGAVPGAPAPAWTYRITTQGPWDPEKRPVSLDGPKALPMPVKISQEEDLEPFFSHLRHGGSHDLAGEEEGEGRTLEGGKGEPYYGTQAAEFRKGVVYEDGRMDLCKMVVGPDHIGGLMDSLRSNNFVRHFLLGNNIIGPCGASAVADFIKDLPDRMETWYLAGNCINGASFKVLVDAMVGSPAITNIWLKRNPLGSGAAEDVARLVTQTPNLRTLDLDQTELGDEGVADLFNRLAAHEMQHAGTLPLRNIYLNGNGISQKGAAAIASFLASPHCALTSLYMSCNPLGNQGMELVAAALPMAPYLARLSCQSVGVSTQGAVAVFKAATTHPTLRMLDLGQAYATEDLGQAYNFIDDEALPALKTLLASSPKLEYFNLAHCPITPPGLADLSAAVLESSSLLFYGAISIVPDPTRAAPTLVPSRDTHFVDLVGGRTKMYVDAERALHDRLEANVKAKYGKDVTYADFLASEKRWLVNDKDVRKIDSVYRNRDAGMARRGLLTLVKDWEEGDTTLDEVNNRTE